jgi:hypothetical protein
LDTYWNNIISIIVLLREEQAETNICGNNT